MRSETAPVARVQEIWSARQLLRNLTVRELKIRYKRSALGFLWSLLNPVLQMAVFTMVFTVAFKAPLRDFSIYFLVGFLPWAFFQASAQLGTGVIVANANLVKKVYFPRAVLPLSIVASQLVHLALALLVLFAVLLIKGYAFLATLPVLLLGLVCVVAMATGVAMLFGAANTVFRDIQEFSGVLFMAWFYVTPIVYTADQLPPRYRGVLRLNPMYSIIELFHDALYRLRYPSLVTALTAVAVSTVTLVVGYRVFQRMAAGFAKEI